MVFVTAGLDKRLDNEVSVSLQGDIYNNLTKTKAQQRLLLVYARRSWTHKTIGQLSIKRVNSIAQTVTQAADKQRGYIANGSYILAAEWGSPANQYVTNGGDGYVFLQPLGYWDCPATLRQGSFPAQGPLVGATIQNQFFWETGINLKTR